MVRVGVNASVDSSLLKDFTREVELVRIPDEPQGTYESTSGSRPRIPAMCRSSGRI